MTFLAKLFKPRWQSKDADVRRTAIVADTSAELIEALPRIARSDADAAIRMAAMKRVADVGLAQTMARDDTAADVRKAAESLWLDLMSGRHAQAPALDVRLRLLGAEDGSKLIEYLAEHASETALRAAALQRVSRPALLIDRILNDRDPALRLATLDRISDEAALNRIAERSRKSDKQIHRRCRERLDALKLERGDAGSIAERARELCERLERQVRDGSDDAGLAAQWDAIAALAPAELVARHASAKALLERSRDPQHIATLRERSIALAAFDDELAALDRETLHATPSQHALFGERLDALAERWSALDEAAASQRQGATTRLAQLTARLQQLGQRHAEAEDQAAVRHALGRARIDQEQAERDRSADSAARSARRQAALAELETALKTMEQALESGHSASAEAAHAGLNAARNAIDGELPAGLRQRLASAEAGHADVVQWRNWGATQRRNQLCEDIEALPEAALHPDALATRVREAQTEWTRIDAAQGATQADALSRRFRAACRRAMEPARPYFEKRDELRSTVSASLNALIERGSALPEEIDDWKAIAALRRELASALRDLDRVDPRQRKPLADRIKAALTGIDERVDAHDAGIAAAKDALIGAATALADGSDRRAAIVSSRDLQKRWQATGNGARRRDEQQWKLFRAAIDAVYAAADAERDQIASNQRQQRDEAAALCDELEALAKADSAPERGSVQRITDAFQAVAVNDDGLRQRFRQAQDGLRVAAQARQHAALRARYVTWLEHWRVCRAVERCDLEVEAARDRIAALPANELDAALLDERFLAAISGIIAACANESEFRDALIRLEQFAGVDSPEQDRQRRMDLQVGQLSAHLRGDGRDEPATRLTRAMTDWLKLGALPGRPDAIDQRFERAYAAAVDRALAT